MARSGIGRQAARRPAAGAVPRLRLVLPAHPDRSPCVGRSSRDGVFTLDRIAGALRRHGADGALEERPARRVARRSSAPCSAPCWPSWSLQQPTDLALPSRGDLGVQRARAVRRRHARVRLPRDDRAQRRDSPCGRAPPRLRPRRLGLALRADGPDPRLHLLPDPADGDRVPAGAGRPRAQWREAAVSLGATTWQYWRQVAGPTAAPAFLGSTLLLFANAFAAYATAAALVSQGSPILPLLIRTAADQ